MGGQMDRANSPRQTARHGVRSPDERDARTLLSYAAVHLKSGRWPCIWQRCQPTEGVPAAGPARGSVWGWKQSPRAAGGDVCRADALRVIRRRPDRRQFFKVPRTCTKTQFTRSRTHGSGEASRVRGSGAFVTAFVCVICSKLTRAIHDCAASRAGWFSISLGAHRYFT